MAITKTYKREDVYDLMLTLNKMAEGYAFGGDYGFPVLDSEEMDSYVDLVISKLGLTIMEDGRILTIQKHTGCTRAQAQSLIDSGEF